MSLTAPQKTKTKKQNLDSEAFFPAYNLAQEKHLRTQLAKVDFAALQAIASRLRNDIPCTLPALPPDANSPQIDLKLVMEQMGGQNCHLDIHFADGIVWIARLRLVEDPTLPPLETQRIIFDSEVALVQFLREKTQLPVPQIFYHASYEQSGIGTPCVLMQKLAGKPLDWNGATAQQRSKVMEQLVNVFLELEKYPFSSMGSLAASTSSGAGIGSYAQPHLFRTPSQSLGPFTSLGDALRSFVEHEMEMISQGEVCTHAVDHYLTHLWRLDQIPNLIKNATHGSSFYIKHCDDKGDHILVDDNFNITGIIDWEWASTECAQLAFSAPCMMWPVAEFYDGSNILSTEEREFAAMFQQRGREDLARIVLEGRKYQRFLFFLGGSVSADREEFEALFQGLRRAVEGDGIGSYADWRRDAIARESQGQNPILAELLQKEREQKSGR